MGSFSFNLPPTAAGDGASTTTQNGEESGTTDEGSKASKPSSTEPVSNSTGRAPPPTKGHNGLPKIGFSLIPQYERDIDDNHAMRYFSSFAVLEKHGGYVC